MSGLPGSWVETLALLAVVAAAFWAGHTWRGLSADAEVSQMRFLMATARTEAANATVERITQYRAETDRRVKVLQEALDAANLQTQALRADAERARAAAVGLHDAAATVAGRCDARGDAAADPAAAGPGAAAGGAGQLLADVLGEVESAGRAMAAEADQRGAAGSLCERAYDGLTDRTTP
jgi:hypothetical protein